MKFAAVLLCFVCTASAAPAIIWKEGIEGRNVIPTRHLSETTVASALFPETVEQSDSLASALFFVGRSENGNEGLTELTASGLLPNVAQKYEDAHSIYYHVDGIESGAKMAKVFRQNMDAKQKKRVVEASLKEFTNKLQNSKESAEEVEVSANGQVLTKPMSKKKKRARTINDADVLIIRVNPQDAPLLDEAVSAAIDSDMIGNVVLSGIRSIEEVKRERGLMARQKFGLMAKKNGARHGRRLEDADGDDAAADDDYDGTIYYVNMTPNIFAGILFTLFFLFVATTGIMCMSQIEGQTVYVTKMPGIGREA